MDTYLLIGLGNIGGAYHKTRHNIGFEVLDSLAKRFNFSFNNAPFSLRGEFSLQGKKIICVKPTTFMNLSGAAFKYWIEKEKIALKNTLTVVDDLALPIEKLRLRAEGSAGGHNGLKNIQLAIQSTQYPRLRFGIGNQFEASKQTEFVLGRWTPSEQPLVQKKIEGSLSIIETFVDKGIEASMALANQFLV